MRPNSPIRCENGRSGSGYHRRACFYKMERGPRYGPMSLRDPSIIAP